ncbi:hypothetical protein NPIL_663891 [Nephila pilipes]|uniref:Uncharacterized protein n=1 Tax=Nephila pilipes TaxID=299642 RepID=A0A8X6U7E5_NEPPI|nr:hypothetical protein NPIL_663891 [Nephila pilipes]
MMDALTNWSDRTDEVMEQSIENTQSNTNSDQGAALPASPSSKIYSEEFFAVNFTMTRRAIQGRNAYAAWARKLGTTKKDDPEFLRVHEELRKSGENLDKVLTQMGDIPLFKLPASEKELDQLVENHKNLAKNQGEAVPKVVATPLRQDRPESAPQGKKSTKRTRDSEGFISPPKHLTRAFWWVWEGFTASVGSSMAYGVAVDTFNIFYLALDFAFSGGVSSGAFDTSWFHMTVL